MARRNKTRKQRGGDWKSFFLGPFTSDVVPQKSTQPEPVEVKKQSLMNGIFGLFTKKTPAASAPAATLVKMNGNPAGALLTGAPAPPAVAPPAVASPPLAGGRRHRKRRTLRKKSKKTRKGKARK